MVGVPGEDSARECLSKRDASLQLRPCSLLGAQGGSARGLTSLGDSAWASVGDGLQPELPGLAGAEPGHEAASRTLGRQAPEGSAERGRMPRREAGRPGQGRGPRAPRGGRGLPVDLEQQSHGTTSRVEEHAVPWLEQASLRERAGRALPGAHHLGCRGPVLEGQDELGARG